MNRLSRYCDGLLEAVWLLVIIFVPLYFLLVLDQPLGVGKTTMLRALVFIGCAAWLAKWISGALRLERKSLPVLWTKMTSQPLPFLVGALAFVYILSTVFSIAPLVSLRGFYFRSEGLLSLLSYTLLFALMTANLRRREQVDRLIITLAAVSFAIDLYAILQHFGLDPLDWDVSVTTRVVSTIGHPIFLAAFLGMTLMIILGRAVFLIQLYRQPSVRSGTLLALIALYLLVCVLNLLSIWYCVARGPLIALLFGLSFFGFTLLVYWQLRRAFNIFASIGVFLLIFIVVLNIPNGPLSGLRDNPVVGPLGRVFDVETGTGRSRVLIWNGMMRLVAPHDPIRFPGDHAEDRWNVIRPLVGYGPETISLVYENYYLPEMLSLESYDLIHDHAHNEFWDVLALYGLLGFFVEYGFFLALIYFALKWLGWIASDKERRLYWLLSILGGLFGGILAFATAGAEFLGIGIPLGLLLGALAVLVLRMFRHDKNAASKPDLWRDMILISSLALVVFHYVEILFGINVITTRVLFWVVCSVMLAVGQGIPAELGKAAPKNDIRQIGIRAGIMIATIMALTPVYLSTIQFGQDASTLIVNSLVSNSSGSLWMFLGMVLFTGLIFELDSAALSNRKIFVPNLALLFGAALFAAFLVWMPYASQLAAIWQSPDLDPPQVIARYLVMLNTQFGMLVVFAYVWALILPEPVNNARLVPPKPLVVAGFGLVHVLALMLSIFVNLHSFQANGLTRVFNGYVKAGQYSAALEVGKHLLELDPWQDAYFLGVADATVDSADSLSGQQGIVQYLMAEKYYKQAFSLNPLYYHNIIGMAHIYRLWARASSDPVMRESRAAQSEQFYADALEGKPYRVKLWVEWADLRDEFGDPQGARQKIDIALKMDDTYAPAYELSARLYLTDAEKQNDPLKRAELLNKAAKDLTAEIEMMNRREENPSLVLMQLGDLYTRLQQYDKAREAYLQAEKLDLGHSQWQVYRNLAEVSGKLNDIAAQREYLKQAIASAPAEESQSLQAILDAIKP